MKNVLLGLGLSLAVTGVSHADSLGTLQKRSNAAALTIIEIMNSNKSIPLNLLSQATCIATFPRIYKVAFVFGGEIGEGFVTCRTSQGWSQAVPTNLRAASFGFQYGARVNKVVMVFTSANAPRLLAKHKIKLGADISWSIGPLTDYSTQVVSIAPGADAYVYAMSQGIMVDASLSGAHMDADNSDTRKLYGHNPQTAIQSTATGASAYLNALDSLISE